MTFNDEHAVATYKSLITISVKLLQSLILLNGGAVVALLTYIGHAANGKAVAAHATYPLSWFVAGLVLSVAAFFGAYVTQLSLYNESIHSDQYKGSHIPWLWSSFAVGVLSLVAFAVGAYAGVGVLSGNVA